MSKKHNHFRKPRAPRWTSALAVAAVVWSGATFDLDLAPVHVGPISVSATYRHHSR